MTKTRSVADTANNNAIPGTRLVDGTVTSSKLDPSIAASLSVGYVNVKDYGAVGDFIDDGSGTNGTDDTQAFVNALATGKPVYVPAWSYRLTDTITIATDSQTLFGDGWFTSRLYYTKSETSGACVRTANENITLHDIGIFNGLNVALDTNRTNIGLEQTSNGNLGLRSVYFTGFGYGLIIGASGAFAKRLVLEQIKQTAITVKSGRKTSISEVTIAGCRQALVVGDGTNNTTCQDNRFSDFIIEFNQSKTAWISAETPGIEIVGKAAYNQFSNFQISRSFGEAIVINNEYLDTGSLIPGESNQQFTNISIRQPVTYTKTAGKSAIRVANSTNVQFTNLTLDQPGPSSWGWVSALRVDDQTSFVRISNSTIGGLTTATESITGEVRNVVLSNTRYSDNSTTLDVGPQNYGVGPFKITDFGTVGTGGDDTVVFQSAISHIKSIGGGDLLIPSGTYNLTSELSLNQGFDVSINLIGLGSNSNRPVLSFSGSVPICVKICNSKSTFIENVVINTANVTGTHVALFINAMWDSMLKNVTINGGSAAAPGATASFGLLVRATYNGYASGTIPFLTTYVDPILSPSGFNMGTYWNSFERVRVGGYTYGLTLAGREGTSASINQNSFVSCKFNANYYNIWCDGTGGGITFISTTAEGSGDDSVTVNRVSSGSSPVWIGGELSGGGKWVGPGLILNAVSGTDYPNPNTSGDNATHLRFTDQGPQLFGNKLGGAEFISDWNSKVSVESGSGTTSSKTLDIIEITGLTATPKSFEITVSFTDVGSPQGGAVLKYIFSAMDVAGSPPISTQLTKLHDHVNWSNLSGGTVDPILTATTVGSTVTITADVNWDNVGTDPGESNVAFTITSEAGVGTVTLL